MTSLNKVILAGNLTRDPVMRVLASGTSVADLGLAINERYKGKSGEWEQRTVFVDAVLWGRQAETVNKYLAKGKQILVEGSLQMDEWITKEGTKRSKLRVNCQQFQFIGVAGGSRDNATATHSG